MAVSAPDSTWAVPVKGGRARAALWLIWETESNRLAIWSPPLLVAGIWAYFALAREPHLAIAIAGLAASLLVAWRFQHHRFFIIIALLMIGFSAAKLRTQWVATPLLRAYTPNVEITGWVRDIEKRGKRQGTIVLDVDTARDLVSGEVPKRIRFRTTLNPLEPLRIGDMLHLKAHLSPLPRPAIPGGFDFGRQLYFESIGATGVSVQLPTKVESDTPWRLVLRRNFHDLRNAIGDRVRAVIKGPLGSFAEALITGERASIPRSMNESLQASGLFHILSISGLHMSLVAGGAFWFARAVLAAFPALALRHPIKKWAAGAAIAIGALYMLLADAGPATERAFIMIAVVFFAVIVDRPAISLHNLAIAAIIILLMQPEQALSASFQMSFMAVMGIAAFFPAFDRTVQRVRTGRPTGLIASWGKWLALLFIASVATSLIAGGLSAIPAAHHFGRFSPYGVVANVLALPAVGLIVMPSAMAAVLLMPVGLESIPLLIMERGLEVVMLVSDWVASWELVSDRYPLLPAPAAIALALAAMILCLSVSKLRLLCMPVVALAWFIAANPQPFLLIDERAANVAVLSDAGWVPVNGRGATFSARRWLESFGDVSSVAVAAKREGWRCADSVCLAAAQGMTIGYLRRAGEGRTPCPKVDILISEFPLRRRCKGKRATIDRFSVWKEGSHSLQIDGSDLMVLTSKAVQGLRPWTYESRPRADTTGKSP